MPDQVANFWQWFEKNNHAFLFTNDVDEEVREELLSQLLTELHKFNDKLYFQVGGSPDGDQELIITAEGDVDQFDDVEKLVAAAPPIKNWIFIAFMQPVDDNNTVGYEGIEITRDDLWFMPLQSSSEPTSIGIRVGVPDYNSAEDKKALDFAVYKIIDTALGEKSFALDIDYLDIAELPDDPSENGWINFAELAAYIAWKKKKLNR